MAEISISDKGEREHRLDQRLYDALTKTVP